MNLFHSPVWYLRQIKRCYIEFSRNLVLNNAFNNKGMIKLIFCFWVVFAILFIVIMFKILINQKARGGSYIFTAFLIICLPIAALPFHLVSDKILYHMLMKESIGVCWILPVMCIDWALIYKKGRIIREIMSVALLIILGNTAIGDNILYLSLYTSYEKTYALENRIVYEIERVNSENVNCLYVHENVDGEEYSDNNLNRIDIDGIGTKNGIIPYVYYTHVFFINQYIGGNYLLPTGDQIEKIRTSEEFAVMPQWPEEGSVNIINDVIVVKLGK